ncbi:MAG: ShlB/FhaC/HecB family hemolysin secretion/activation protein [Gammaproteobacteria bacterium]
MNPRASRVLLATLACLGVLSSAAWAQAVPTPGQVREQLRPTPTVPTTTPPSVSAPAPGAAAGVPTGGRAVLVSAFEISGNRAIGTDELQQVIAPFAGRPLTIAEIYEAADALTRHYRTQGYTLASAYVPQQKISSGVIHIEILEGTLGAVQVEGTRRTRAAFVNWQLDRLHPGEPLRDEPLQNELLLLNDIPGLDAKAVVRPGAEFGSSDLVLTAQEDLFDANARYNNYGRESIGEERLEAGAGLNGLLGVGDRLDVNGVYAEGDLLHYGRLAYSLPVSPWGTRASVYYAAWDYKVNSKRLGAGLELLDIAGEGDNFGVRVDHPVWRTTTHNLYVGFGIDRTNTDQRERAFGTRTQQDLTLASVNALFTYLAPDQSFSTLGATFSTNFNGAEREIVPPGILGVENNAQTAKLQFDLSHYRPVFRQLSLLTRFTGVVSVDPLVDLERFRIGGPNSVRGYAAAEFAGDSGYFLSFELQHPIPFVTAVPTLLKGFFDTGTVHNKNHNLLGVKDSQSLSGAGVGLQTSLYQKIFIDLAVAQPIGAHDSSDTDRGARFWMNVSANF